MPQDDDTKRKGWMSQEERDLAELARRRAGSQSEVAAPPSLPALERGEEITSPTNMHALERYHNDPAYRELWDYTHAWKHAALHGIQRVGDHALAEHQQAQPSHELADRIDAAEETLHRMDTAMKLIKWIGGFVVAACLASIVVVATKIFNWGVSTGEVEVRLNRLEHDVQQILDHRAPQSWPALAAPQPKGATP